MKLKCIGGICDGYTMNVSNEYRKNDITRVPIKVTFDLNDFYRSPSNVLSNIGGPTYAYYKLIELEYHNPDYLLKFLTPTEWSIPQALAHLIGCHHGV